MLKQKLKFYAETLKETFRQWNDSPASRFASGLAYSAVFSIPGLLIIIIWIAGNFFGEEAIRGEISHSISGLMGQDAAKSVESMITAALVDKHNIFMKTVGVLSLVFGSTTLFFQLQRSLNDLWDVEAAPKTAFLKFFLDRATSLSLILVMGLLLIISMLLTSIIGLFGSKISGYFGFHAYNAIVLLNGALGSVVVMLIFAFIFKVLPDVKIGWEPVWAGAFLTALLFAGGKFLLGLYFSKFRPASAFGTAGTVILIMMWINYSCMLLFFGAIFTKVFSIKKGITPQPSKHARWNARKLYLDSQLQEKTELG